MKEFDIKPGDLFAVHYKHSFPEFGIIPKNILILIDITKEDCLIFFSFKTKKLVRWEYAYNDISAYCSKINDIKE